MEHTEFITINGHRREIENLKFVFDTLRSEGWIIEAARVYKNDGKNRDADYVTNLIHRTFKNDVEK